MAASPVATCAAENLQRVCTKAAFGTGLENAARSFDRIILALFAANTLMIITHRYIHDKDFWTIHVGNRDIELPHPRVDMPDKYIDHLDNILFTVNFMLLSYLTVLQFMPHGKVTIG